jgi:aryl-alcohol dehydrogenase-like predicted oxidoreductase
MKKLRLTNDTLFSRRDVMATASIGVASVALARITRANAQTALIMTRPIPQSGEKLSVVGLGTSIVFQIGEDPVQRAQRRAVIETMVAGGASLIDTASTYGTAESVVGDLVQQAGLRDKVFIATKCEVRNRGASIAEMQESLRRLKTSKLDLMQLHNVNNPRADLALYREWKAQGICRYIGITTSFNGDHDALAAVTAREKPEFVQVNYSIVDRDAEKRVLPAAKDADAAVLTNLPFGRGGLFRITLGKPLPEWAAEFDAATWGQFFLKFLLSHEAVTAVIPGTERPEHMLDNLGAGRGRLPDATMRKRMVSFIEQLG